MATTKTHNEYFSGTGVGNKVFTYAVHHLMVHITGTVSIGFDGTNFMTLTPGNHELYNIGAKTIYFGGSGTWVGWGVW
jgi:hypothetical protein